MMSLKKEAELPEFRDAPLSVLCLTVTYLLVLQVLTVGKAVQAVSAGPPVPGLLRPAECSPAAA